MKRSLFIVLISLVALCLAISLYKTPIMDNNAGNRLEKKVMGVSLDYPPFEFISQGKPSGYDIDLANLIAEELKFKVEIKDMDFNSLIPALNSGQIDFIISSMSPTPEREERVDFTRVYYKSKVEIVTLNTVADGKALDLLNKKVGVQMGSSIETYAKKQQATTPGLTLLAVSRVPQLIEELKLGRIYGVILDAEIAKTIVAKNSTLKSTKIKDFNEGNAIVLPKNSKLTGEFNEALDKFEREGKLVELEKKWIIKDKK